MSLIGHAGPTKRRLTTSPRRQTTRWRADKEPLPCNSTVPEKRTLEVGNAGPAWQPEWPLPENGKHVASQIVKFSRQIQPSSSDRVGAVFRRADTDYVDQLRDEDLAIADLVGPSAFENGIDHFVRQVIGHDRFHFDFGDEIDGVFRSTISLGMPFLPAKASHFRNGHSLNSQFRESLLNGIQLEVSNNRFNFFHRTLRLGQKVQK